MSNHDKKESSQSQTSSVESNDKNVNEQDHQFQRNTEQFSRNAKENDRIINESLEETRKNIERNTNEAKSQIPRYTQSIHEVQEQSIQATQDIAKNYLDYQKQLVDFYRSMLTPFLTNVNNQTWNNQGSLERISQVYSKLVNNYTENMISMSRIFNDTTFSNIDMFKNAINNINKQSKHFSDIGKRNIRTCEEIKQDNREAFSSTNKTLL